MSRLYAYKTNLAAKKTKQSFKTYNAGYEWKKVWMLVLIDSFFSNKHIVLALQFITINTILTGYVVEIRSNVQTIYT